jgi:hypothetical protein
VLAAVIVIPEASSCNLAYEHHAVGITLKPVYLPLAILSRSINTRITDILFFQHPAYGMDFRDKPRYDNQLMSFLNAAFKDILKGLSTWHQLTCSIFPPSSLPIKPPVNCERRSKRVSMFVAVTFPC